MNKKPPEAAMIFTEILVWFYSNYGVKKSDKDPYYDVNDKWLTDKKKWERATGCRTGQYQAVMEPFETHN